MRYPGKIIFALSAVSAASFSMLPLEAPRIKKKETVNFSNLVAPVETVYVAPGKTKEYTLYGPWLEFATKVTFMSADQPITDRAPGIPFVSDAKIKVQMTGSGSRALRTATISIACPPFTDCQPTHTFPVRVLSTGTLTSIDPSENVAGNTYRHFRINGTNLDNATVFLFRTDLAAVGNVTNSAGTLDFDARTASCGTNRVRVRDAAEGGDFYPFPGGLDIRLSTACDGRIVPSPSSPITGTPQPAAPDLQATGGAPVLRHVAANRKLLSEPFCHSMYAQAVQATVRTITVPNITWGVRNGGASISQTFHARLYRNGVQVADSVVNGLSAGASKTFTYVRPQSQTEVARLGLVPPSLTMQLYNATGGECVQTVGQAAQFDWQDPAYEIRIDVVTNESNQTNNRKSF